MSSSLFPINMFCAERVIHTNHRRTKGNFPRRMLLRKQRHKHKHKHKPFQKGGLSGQSGVVEHRGGRDGAVNDRARLEEEGNPFRNDREGGQGFGAHNFGTGFISRRATYRLSLNIVMRGRVGEGGVFGTICAGNVSFLVGYSHLLDGILRLSSLKIFSI